MTGKKQPIEREELRAARQIMIRALSILAAVAAFAVSAAPVASASSSKKAPPRTAQVVVLIGANDYGLVAKPPPRGTTGVVTDNKDPDQLGKVYAGGARVIEVPSVKYTTVNAMFFPWDMASKTPPKPRRHQLTTSTPDGTSNTVMWSGSRKPPNGIIAILIG